jgi:group II intron reverse transcriptase/maturase
MSPGLLKVAERAKRDPDAKFNSLAHLMDEVALERAFTRIRKDAAVGVDGISKEEYGQRLEDNLRELVGRLKAKRYRHQPIKRVHIPKANGKTRPIGISCTEDKIVQGALREILETIYEQDFLECSYGFRPNRSAHDALRAVDQMVFREGATVVLEADIQAYFDSIDRKKLLELLQIRVADPSLLRLIGKCLHVGVLDGEEYNKPNEGTAQGSIISPMFGNVYLHYVLDQWFEDEIKPRLKGRARLIRYADDFVIGFERQDDAERVREVLYKRMAKYGLTLHPDKTRLIPFERPPKGAN